MSFKNYEKMGFMHDLELLIISHQLNVSHPTRSGCMGGHSIVKLNITCETSLLPYIIWHNFFNYDIFSTYT